MQVCKNKLGKTKTSSKITLLISEDVNQMYKFQLKACNNLFFSFDFKTSKIIVIKMLEITTKLKIFSIM